MHELIHVMYILKAAQPHPHVADEWYNFAITPSGGDLPPHTNYSKAHQCVQCCSCFTGATYCKRSIIGLLAFMMFFVPALTSITIIVVASRLLYALVCFFFFS